MIYTFVVAVFMTGSLVTWQERETFPVLDDCLDRIREVINQPGTEDLVFYCREDMTT